MFRSDYWFGPHAVNKIQATLISYIPGPIFFFKSSSVLLFFSCNSLKTCMRMKFGVSLLIKSIHYISSAFLELQELSSLVCQHTVYAQQSMEEEKLGPTRLHELFCEKK